MEEQGAHPIQEVPMRSLQEPVPIRDSLALFSFAPLTKTKSQVAITKSRSRTLGVGPSDQLSDGVFGAALRWLQKTGLVASCWDKEILK